MEGENKDMNRAIEEGKRKSNGYKYNNIPISRIMKGSFVTVIILTIIMMFLAMLSLYHVSSRTEKLYQGPFLKSAMVFEIKECIAQIERDFYHSLMTDDMQEVEELLYSIEDYNKVVANDLEILSSLASVEEQTLLEECYNLLDNGTSTLNEIQNKITNSKIEEAYEIIEAKYMPILDSAEKLMEKMTTIALGDAEDFVKQANLYMYRTIMFNILFLAAAFCFALWVSRKVTVIITKPIFQVKDAMSKMEEGNLDITLSYTGKNELGVMSQSMQSMTAILRRYVQEIARLLQEVANKNMDLLVEEDFKGDFMPIRDSLHEILDFLNKMIDTAKSAAGNVNMEAGQVAKLSADLADTSAEQASAVQQLVVSVNEVTCNVEGNAKYAKHVNKISQESVQKIEKGNAYMNNLLNSMQEIGKQSEEISGIMKAIDSIARQTNLLSLNASIEAARAGDAGLGFAVVAQEIGNLARESTEAAKNTAVLIQSNIEVTKKGSELANETAEVLGDIVKSVEETGTLVGNITEACSQQASALEDISIGVRNISESVEHLSGMSQEASAASEELLSQAELLENMMGQYILKKE